MKPSLKIALLLVIVVGSVSVWLWRPSWRQHAKVVIGPQTSRASAPTIAPPLAPATPTPAPATSHPIPALIQPIVAATPALPFPERVKRVRALHTELSTQEIQAFYAYLLAPAPSGTADQSNENWLRNEMMDKLVDQPTLPAGLAGLLVSIYEDPTQHIVMRDYALQHVTPIYARVSVEEQATLQQTMWRAVDEADSSIAGTALLALRDLAQDHREFDASKVGEVALKLASDDRCGELSRITALQLCGRMGLNQAAPLILQVAQKAESVPLQIAAIAALGDVGNEEARNYLRQLAVASEPRLKPALQTSLKKMNGRLGI